MDANHVQIRDYLRAKGWSVLSLASLGNGVPDLLVARAGWAALVELKSDEKKKLNPDQQRFALGWNGVCLKASSAEEVEDKLRQAERDQFLRKSLGGT